MQQMGTFFVLVGLCAFAICAANHVTFKGRAA